MLHHSGRAYTIKGGLFANSTATALAAPLFSGISKRQHLHAIGREAAPQSTAFTQLAAFKPAGATHSHIEFANLTTRMIAATSYVRSDCGQKQRHNTN
jgi:hypothetical protein